ncbi:MAG: hypothetical protein DDT30_01446 [Dehalococcoidia bacterium]|nr:hypothetical protein [Bacillota bacterium]MBT9143973.1 hypothetical protein [Bacillota bacterium]
MKNASGKLLKGVKGLEVILAAFIIISVIISGYDLIARLIELMASDYQKSYSAFKDLLAYILLLVIGLELAMMLIRHTPGSVIEIMLYAVARKMLIYSTETFDIAIGVFSLAGLFAIKKFLYVHRIEYTNGLVVGPSASLKNINSALGIHIPDEGGKTLIDLILNLADDRDIKEGEVFYISDAEMTIVKVVDKKPVKIRVNESKSD